MTGFTRPRFQKRGGMLLLAGLLVLSATSAHASPEHPLEPLDRSSPRATLTSFLELPGSGMGSYSAGDPGYRNVFRETRDCLDLSDVPPLVFDEASARAALLLKEVLDRIELPPFIEIPDAATVGELELERWTIPHTEITLDRIADGDQQGQWVFSPARFDESRNSTALSGTCPTDPVEQGGHIEELQSASRSVLLLKLIRTMPSWAAMRVGGMMVWQWFGLSLLIGLLAMGLVVVAWLARRLRAGGRSGGLRLGRWCRRRCFRCRSSGSSHDRPSLHPPRNTGALVAGGAFGGGAFGLAWLAALAVIRVGELSVQFWFRDARPLKKPQLRRVMFRIATIIVVTAIGVVAMQRLGVPVAGLVAGLGVGGLAIALAAQSTLENFIGGIILYADQPVRVGDICKFGDRRGTVEDVGLRSVKVRTIDNTVVTVPNATFAKMQLENLSERDRILLREILGLRYETTRDQLRTVLSNVESMLRSHGSIDDDRLRVRFDGFGDAALKIEIYAYAMAETWPEFLEIREDVLFKVMEIIEDAGTRLALPTEVHYAAEGLPGSRGDVSHMSGAPRNSVDGPSDSSQVFETRRSQRATKGRTKHLD